MFQFMLTISYIPVYKYDIIRIPQISSIILYKKIKLFLKRISCFNQIYNYNKNPLNTLF